MPTWCFKTASRHTRDSHTHQWYWQIEAEHALSPTSIRLFPTIEECVADARENGFVGEVGLPDALSHPAMIACDQIDFPAGGVERLMFQRSERRAA